MASSLSIPDVEVTGLAEEEADEPDDSVLLVGWDDTALLLAIAPIENLEYLAERTAVEAEIERDA